MANNDSAIIMESIIRDAAAEVINGVVNREAHPSYGNTKTGIRYARERMEGMVGMYMVLTGQANHHNIPSVSTFTNKRTAERVATARRMTDSL
jgi:hypothetical protein